MTKTMCCSLNASAKCHCFCKSNTEIILVYDKIKCNTVLKNKVIFSLDYKVLNDKGNQDGKDREQCQDDRGTLLVAERPLAPGTLHRVPGGASRWLSPLRHEEHGGTVGADKVLVPCRVLALANGAHAEAIFTVELEAGIPER